MKEEAFIPYYDTFHEQWCLKEVCSGIMYPMTSQTIANEMSDLLNRFNTRLHNVLGELYIKDRKLEELGYNLDELDVELGLSQ